MVNHTPVLLKEVIHYLDPQPGQNFVDGTFGWGGHARAILEQLQPRGRLFVFDLDPLSISEARRLGPKVECFQNNFRDLEKTIRYVAPHLPIHGVVLDLGISSVQLNDSSLGLSWQTAGPLNMRLGRDNGMTAAIIVNTWSEKELTALFRDYGEERQALSVARAIVQRRREKPFVTTTDLAEVAVRAMKFSRGAYQRIHPATKIFQALRLAVNQELENLSQGMAGAFRILTSGGRLAVISFHSLEDRIVKQAFREAARDCLCPPMTLRCVCGHRAIGSVLTKKPVRPSLSEVAANPRARSAKLRVFKKI